MIYDRTMTNISLSADFFRVHCLVEVVLQGIYHCSRILVLFSSSSFVELCAPVMSLRY
jgi:hypothetical protein